MWPTGSGGEGSCGECPSSEENRMKIVRKNVITTPTAKLATSPAASPTVCVHNAVARPSTEPRKLDAKDEVDVSAVVGRVGRVLLHPQSHWFGR